MLSELRPGAREYMFPVISAFYVKNIITSVMGLIWAIDFIERMVHIHKNKICVDSLILFLYQRPFILSTVIANITFCCS